MRDPYTVLGISKDAGDQAVRKAYKKLAARHHPDRSSEPDAADRFKEVVEAYAILTNEHDRRRYIRQRRREHAEQQERAHRQQAEARRQAAQRQSATATAAEEAFRNYARQVQQRRRQQQAASSKSAARTWKAEPAQPDTFLDRVGDVTALLLMAIYVYRSAIGLPLQPWLTGGMYDTHPLTSPIWITLSFGLMMIVRPRWFEIPLFIESLRDIRIAGWALFLLCPLISAGWLHPERLPFF